MLFIVLSTTGTVLFTAVVVLSTTGAVLFTTGAVLSSTAGILNYGCVCTGCVILI